MIDSEDLALYGMSEDDNACYLPGWDDGPDGMVCELPDEHEGQHATLPGTDLEVAWDVTWVVDEEDFPFGD